MVKKGQSYPQHADAFEAIDQLVERIERFRTPYYAQAVQDRSNPAPRLDKSDREMLQTWVTLIAYSNNARSSAVDRLRKQGILDKVFCEYDPQAVAQLDPARVLDEYWTQIKSIRFKYKVKRIVGCAQVLLDLQRDHGSFQRYLEAQDIPMLIRDESALERFWRGFDAVWKYFKDLNVPHLKNQTTLCHLFLELGYDCAKPDVAVMGAAVKLGLTPPSRRKSGGFSDGQCRDVVQLMQRYAIHKGIRVPLVDLYLLIHGGQTGNRKCVRPEYYQEGYE